MKHIIVFCFLIGFPIANFGQWVERNTPFSSLDYIYFLDDSIGYCGSQYVSYKSTDAGWTWQPATGDYANFQKACFLDSLNGFAISYAELFQTTDGGASWLNISDSVNITEFYHLEERNGHIILNGRNPSQGYFWYVTQDGGNNWEMRNQHPTRSPWICHVLDNDHFYLADHYNHTIAATSNGGTTWDTVYHQVFVDTYLTAIYFSSPDTGVIGYQSFWGSGWIEKTYAGIHNFQTAPPQIDQTFIHGVYFLEGNKNTICGGGERGYFYCSPDRGEHWFLQPVNANSNFKTLRAAYFWDENRIAVVGDSGRVLLTDSGIYHSLQTESHLNTEHITVFPNPSTGMLTIETPNIAGNTWTMTLTSSAGQTLTVQPLEKSQQTIDASHLPKGVYFMRLQSERGVVTRKVVLQ